MLASRTKDDAIQLSGLLQIAESAAAISKAAGDIVGIREINPQNGPFLSFVLRDAEEKILPLTINKKSDMRGKSIDDMLIVRGTEDGFRRLRKFAHGEEKWPTYPVE